MRHSPSRGAGRGLNLFLCPAWLSMTIDRGPTSAGWSAQGFFGVVWNLWSVPSIRRSFSVSSLHVDRNWIWSGRMVLATCALVDRFFKFPNKFLFPANRYIGRIGYRLQRSSFSGRAGISFCSTDFYWVGSPSDRSEPQQQGTHHVWYIWKPGLRHSTRYRSFKSSVRYQAIG